VSVGIVMPAARVSVDIVMPAGRESAGIVMSAGRKRWHRNFQVIAGGDDRTRYRIKPRLHGLARPA
jgi:hypothetical protein